MNTTQQVRAIHVRLSEIREENRELNARCATNEAFRPLNHEYSRLIGQLADIAAKHTELNVY